LKKRQLRDQKSHLVNVLYQVSSKNATEILTEHSNSCTESEVKQDKLFSASVYRCFVGMSLALVFVVSLANNNSEQYKFHLSRNWSGHFDSFHDHHMVMEFIHAYVISLLEPQVNKEFKHKENAK
jgi:hypothetical protein